MKPLTPEEEEEARRNTERTGPQTFTRGERETLRRIWASVDAERAAKQLALEEVGKLRKEREAVVGWLNALSMAWLVLKSRCHAPGFENCIAVLDSLTSGNINALASPPEPLTPDTKEPR